MTARVADLSEILLDTGPFCRFCEADELAAFADYLGSRAKVVRDVEVEIGLRSKSEAHSALTTLQWTKPPFPEHKAVAPTASQIKKIDRIRDQLAKPGDPPFSHLGEIATVVIAQDRGGTAVMIDDIEGRRLARARGLPLFSTAGLSIEMVAAGALEKKVGRGIFLSTGQTRTREQFEKLLRQHG